MRRAVFLTIFLLTCLAASVEAQVQIQAGSTATETFTIGTTTTAPLPSGWKADKQTVQRTLGNYASAVSATEQRAGNNMSSSATNGIYNLGAGDATTATDRSVGFISSNSATKTGNLYVWLQNSGAATINSITVSYNVEKYRGGSNAAGFSMQMYYSTNGSTWTSAGASFLTSFPADANNNGYASAPGATVPVSASLSVPVAASGNLYLAWSYSVTTGTTTSNAQCLAIDDVSLTPVGGAPAPTVTTLPATSITAISALFNGTVNANGASTTVTFDYGLTTGYGQTTTANQSPVTGSTATAVDATASGLSVNVQYHFRASGNSTGGTTNGSDEIFWTLANVPGVPTVGTPTTSSLTVTPDANGNPASTEFAIRESSTSQYVQANGSLGASAVWQTAATWGTITVTGLAPATQYTFDIKARNGASVETAFGSPASYTTNSATTPVITTTGAFTTFLTPVGTPSAEQSCTVSGVNLTTDITVTAPTEFQVSLTTGSGFGASVVLPQSGGTVNATTVFVRYNPAAAGMHADSVSAASTGALTQLTAVSGNSVPEIATAGSVTTVSRVYVGTSSFTSQITVEGQRLTSDLVVTAPAQYQVSSTDSSTGFTGSVSFTPVAGVVTSSPVWIRFTPATGGSHNDSVAVSATNAVTRYIPVSGSAIATEPTTQCAITIGSIAANSIEVNFTGGNGAKRLLVAKYGSAVTQVPVDARTYTASASYAGAGSGIGVSPYTEYVVYAGTGSTVTVTGLTGASDYHFAVYEYNDDGAAGAENYLGTTPGTGFATTLVDPGSLVFEDNFSYTLGDNLTSNGYSAHSAGGTSPIKVTTPGGLAYAGYASSGIGNAATVANVSGEDVNHVFSPAFTYGSTVYMTLLVNVTTASTAGDYFCHLQQGGSTSVFRARVYAKSDGAGGVKFGIAANNLVITYTTGSYALNTTYLLAVRYTFTNTPSATNTADLFVNPLLNAPLPGTPDATSTEASTPTDIGAVALRQGSTSSSKVIVDGIRIGSSWGMASGNVSYASPATLQPGNYSDVSVTNATITIGGDVTIHGALMLDNSTLSIGAHTLTLNGAITSIGGTLTGGGSSALVLGGSGASTALPAVSLSALTIDRANGITLAGNVDVQTLLQLQNGVLDPGANTLTMGNGSTLRRVAGSLASAPVFGTAMTWDYAPTGSITTGAEIPATGEVLNVLLSGSGTTALGQDCSIAGTLTFTSGWLDAADHNLLLKDGMTIAGTPSAASMLVTSGTGQVRREFTSTGSFTFPVGDLTGTADYSPMTLAFTTGSFAAGAWAGVRTVDGMHPDNPAGSDCISRYWNAGVSGITGFTCDVTGSYVPADVVGSETGVYTGKWDGTAWSKFSAANIGMHQIAATGITSFSDFTGGPEPVMDGTVKFALRLKAVLDGAWNPTLATMTSKLLTAGVLPLSQPYGTAPWNHMGTESFTTLPTSAVDWVLVELRDPTTPSIVLQRRAAMLLADGQVVDVTGGPVWFTSGTPGTYHVALRHRNHLAIMTSTAQSLSLSSALYDFTTSQTQAWGTNAMTQVAPGVFALPGGDANADGLIGVTDFVDADNNQWGDGYLLFDTNLDSFIDSQDFMAPDNHQLMTTQVP